MTDLPDEHLETLEGPDGSMEAFYCPECGLMNDPEALLERGHCFSGDCDWEVEG
jgi:hypothetical protein